MSWVDDKLGLNAGVWYAGATTPPEGIGKNNDFYVILGEVENAGLVYHKANGTWSLVGSLTGEGGPGIAVVGIWHSGTALPSSLLGSTGDFYLQTGDTSADGTVHQKQAGTWVEVGSIKNDGGGGPVEVVGIWHSGTALPTALLGVDGDFYLQTGDTSADGTVHQRQSGVWVIVGSIIFEPPTVVGIWHSGTALPTALLGNDGDFYLQTGDTSEDGTVHQKQSGVWVEVGTILFEMPPVVGIWHYDNALPDGALGSDGDFFLFHNEEDDANGAVYAKQGGAWNEVGTIKPPPPPTPVGIWHYDNVTPPDAGLGSPGDFYLFNNGEEDADGAVWLNQGGTWNEVGTIKPPTPAVPVGLWHYGDAAPTAGLGQDGDFYAELGGEADNPGHVYLKDGIWSLAGTIAIPSPPTPEPLNNFHPVDVFSINSTKTNATGRTVGSQFFIRQGASTVSIVGIRWHWNLAGGELVKVSLYDAAGGAALKTFTSSTFGIGPHQAFFTTPYLVAGGTGVLQQKLFTVAFYETVSGKYSHINGTIAPLSVMTPARPFLGGPRLGWVAFNRYGLGDTNPLTDGAAEWVMVEPILVDLEDA